MTLFPKTKRYTLGQKIDQISLDIFELIFKVNISVKDQKLEILQNISNKIDLLKILIRLAHDNKYLSTSSYLNLQESLQEIGKMAGGWLRYFKTS